MLTVLLPSAVYAATLFVGGPGEYRTIGEAVAEANDGDTIEVEGGRYDESVTFDVNVTVRGMAGPGGNTWSTFIGDTVNVEGAEVTIEGFTFEAGGRAIDIIDGDVVLRDVEVFGQTALDRPGAVARAHPGTSLVIEDSAFGNNSSTLFAGGHIFAEDAEVVIRRSTFIGGSASDGGCIWAAGSELTLEDVTIQECEGELGGGIYLTDSTLHAERLDLSYNDVRTFLTDPDGGGLFAEFSEIEISDSTVAHNNGGVTGGGLRLVNGSGFVDETTFQSNQADFGGALYLENGSFEVYDSFFNGNLAFGGSGGAIRWRHDGGELTLAASRFVDNESDGAGGAVATLGQGAPSDLYLLANVMQENAAATGGAASLAGHGTLESTTNRFCANTAVDGGAVNLTGNGGLWLQNNFISNLATGDGGGMRVVEATDVLLGANDFLGNHAAQGGGVHSEGSEVAFVNNLVAFSEGSGLTAVSTTGLLSYSAFWDNTPDDLSAQLAKAAGAGMVYANPLLTDFSEDLNCDNDNLLPLVGSPLIDAGDPAILDTDGSRSDIGSVTNQTLEAGQDFDADGFDTTVDCNDTDPLINPDAEEDCSDVDRDCSGDPYDAPGGDTYYSDGDGDGFGNVLETTQSCVPPDGYVRNATDCRDDNPSVFPGATEVCNGQDDDCDQLADEGLLQSWYVDADADGYGTGVAIDQCDAPAGYAPLDGDCNDDDASVNPDASDTEGDGVDANCDGSDGNQVLTTTDESLKATGSCGCTTRSPHGAAGAAWVLLMGLALRRRR